MSEKILCSYFGCDKPIAQDEQQYSDQSMKFCEAHRDEINQFIVDFDTKGILSFWIRAQGGAKRAADRMLGKEVKGE